MLHIKPLDPNAARRALLLLLGVAVAGCGPIYYQARQGSPTAVLTIVNQSAVAEVDPGLYERADCSGGRRALAAATVSPGGSRTFIIEADKTAFVAISGFRTAGAKDRVTEITSNVCEAFFGFVPEAGRKYAVSFADGDGHGCALGVSGDGARYTVELPRPLWLAPGQYEKAGWRRMPRCPGVASARPQ